ncbi:MAG TPA: glycosyltransferase family 1 protein [Ktedonobacterales bacterium]|nr:glycosyltransferase family 1 protein [Ktedonobacterales bacterium]
MRIAIDYTPAIVQTAGIGRYTRELVAALARLESGDDFTLFSADRPVPERPFPQAPNMRTRLVPVGNLNLTRFWQRLRVPLPASVLMGRADVIHGPDFILPPVTIGAATVVTIHDLAFLTHPECAVPSLARYLSNVVPRAVRKADCVIADSQSTADDLVRLLDTDPKKVRPILLGISPRLSPQRDEAAIARLRAAHRIEAPAVVAVGTVEPRKNYARLVTAFAEATRAPGGPRTLVIAGRKGWLYDDVFAAIEQSGVGDRVRMLDFLPDADLPTLYHLADVLAMPSIYEGFGIPAAEAMASGTPVVYGDVSSLPEVVGDAGLGVPPEDVGALRDALLRVLRDDALRRTLIARGLARAARFSWDTAAAAHLEVYHEAARRHRS